MATKNSETHKLDPWGILFSCVHVKCSIAYMDLKNPSIKEIYNQILVSKVFQFSKNTFRGTILNAVLR